MTIEEIKAMDDAQLRRAIAEKQGWTNLFFNKVNIPARYFGDRPDGITHYPVPEFEANPAAALELFCEIRADDNVDVVITCSRVEVTPLENNTPFGRTCWMFEFDNTPSSICRAIAQAFLFWAANGENQ